MYEDRAVDLAHPVRDTVDTARDAGAEVLQTTRDEAAHVAQEAADQTRRVSSEVKGLLRSQVDRQHHQLAARVGGFADELAAMAGEQPQTPARELVASLAARSSAFAAYLDRHGPDVVLAEVQDFARRRPGTFIAAAVAAGFVAGRLGKGVWQSPRPDSKP